MVQASTFYSRVIYLTILYLCLSVSKTDARKTWSGKETSDRFCALDDNNQCHWGDYANWLAKSFIAGAAVAVISLLAFFVFTFGRFCCNCWGGKKPSSGVFISSESSFSGYSRSRVLVLKIILAIVFLVIVAFAIVGFVGNHKIDSGVNTTADTITNVSDWMSDQIIQIQTIFAELPDSTTNYTAEISALASTIGDYQVKAEDTASEIKKFNRYRSPALIISFVLPLALLLLASIATIFNLNKLSLAAGLLCFICSFILWTSFGVHLMSREVIADVCTEVKYAMEGNSSNANVNAVVSCLSNASEFSNLRTAAESGLDTAQSTACSTLNNLCSQSIVTCPVTYSGASCNNDNLEKATTTITLNDGGVTRTLQECSTSCTNSQFKSTSATAVTSLDQYNKYYSLVEEKLLPLLDCSFIASSTDQLNTAVCKTLRNGVNMIIVASSFIGLCLVPATILLIMGYKRFKKNLQTLPNKTNYYEVSPSSRVVVAA